MDHSPWSRPYSSAKYMMLLPAVYSLLGAVTVLQAPPLLELMTKASCEWQNPSICTFLGSGLPATFH